ncbi:MAG: hypothetical protein ACJATA_000347 [Sphingobacteriales bacterium]|jgi:hypothetical protein
MVTISILDNDEDVDLDGNLESDSVKVVQGPQNGNASIIAEGKMEYTPSALFNGLDSFT